MSETQMDNHWNLSEVYRKIKGTFTECSESHGISINSNQRGMPASTKKGALEEKIQLAEVGVGFSQQKRWTLRALLRYLKNSDCCIKLTNSSSFHA